MRKVSRWFIFVNRELIINCKKLCPILCFLFSLVSVLTIGCGKKADEESETAPPHTKPQVTDIEEELNKQQLFCAGDANCPSYLTKVAIINKEQLTFCTGFLTKDDVVITASSCLPERLRIRDAGCAKNIYFFFAESNEKPTKIGCKKILEVIGRAHV